MFGALGSQWSAMEVGLRFSRMPTPPDTESDGALGFGSCDAGSECCQSVPRYVSHAWTAAVILQPLVGARPESDSARAYAPRTLACGEIPSAALRGLVAQSDECPWDRIDILKNPRASVMLGSHQKAHLLARRPPSGQRQLPVPKLPS